MNKNQGTFQRYEKKYMLTEESYKALRGKLESHLIVDGYGKSSICNVYFDTPNNLLIRNSIEKPIYKEKLRLRSYGVPKEGDMVFIELKKKYDGVVFKRRVRMELTQAKQYLYDGKKAQKETQIVKEIDWFLSLYKNQYDGPIKPSMYISYQRIAMYGVEDENLRVTFDSDIIWREEDLNLESGIWGNALLPEGYRLMEIKILGAMPLWLSHILDELEIYPSSFSKYGKAYEASIQSLNLCRDRLIEEIMIENKGVIKYA